MNDMCPTLPATGSSATTLIVVGLGILLIGLVALVVGRRRVLGGLGVLIAIVAVAVASMAQPAHAVTCPSTTPTNTSEAVVSPTSESLPSTSDAPSSSASPSTTTPSTSTTEPVETFTVCARQVNDPSIDFFFDLVDGFGTVTGYAGGSGCTGEVLGQFPVGDSSVVDPEEWCATNYPGTDVGSATDGAPWTPPIPLSLFACIPAEPPPPTTADTTSTSSTTTTTTTTTTTVPLTAPDAVDDSFSIGFPSTGGGNVLANDAPGNPPVVGLSGASYAVFGDPNAPLPFATPTFIGCGELTLDADGSFTFAPALAGSACQFTYSIDNGAGADTASVFIST